MTTTDGNRVMSAADTIDRFLSAVAARQPTPGGGAVSALAGALAAAIGEMVLNYSAIKKDLAEHRPQLESALAELKRARQIMAELLIEDQLAFAAMTRARKLPADAPDRQPTLDATLVACIRGPQGIAATAMAILQLSQKLVPIVNRHLLSDLAVCAELAMATVRCALYNVRVNLNDLTDAGDRQKLEATSADMLQRATRIISETIPHIWQLAAAT